ncbi:MAG: baseplate J/gp47 family protein [Candidatus Spyradocola sp.]|jgi:hypothetical protein
MLRTENLDDQTFAEIVEEAVKSIPTVFPEWTDHNAHDPGITLLELFSWYKEMQQYHLNCPTERAMNMYLKLLGMERRDIAPARATVCFLNLAGEFQITAGDEISAPGGATFTFDEDARVGGDRVEALLLQRGEDVTDITELILRDQMKIRAFHGGADLWIGLARSGGPGPLSLLLTVADEYPVPRNPFAPGETAGRKIRVFGGSGAELPVLQDGTCALSKTGVLALDASAEGETDPLGRGVRTWVRISQERPGCEEEPQIQDVCAAFAQATQRKTLVRSGDFFAEGRQARIPRRGVLEKQGKCFLLARDAHGWRAVEQIRYAAETVEAELPFDPAEDGEPNLRAIFYEEWMAPHLTSDGEGQSGFAWPLPVDGQVPDVGAVRILGKARTPGGDRYVEWTYAPDLNALTPFDRCFSYDPEQGAFLFGDNERGEVAPRGQDALLLADFSLTMGGQGHFPAAKNLQVNGTEITVRAGDFQEGQDRESAQAVRARLMRRLREPSRAVTEADYAAFAKRTPGLRVMQAGAIAGYDPDRPLGADRCVTVAVLPYSTGPRPLPDADFLQKVQAQLEAVRPVCTRVKAVAPLYIRIHISVTVLTRVGAQDVEAGIRRAVEGCFASDETGWRLGERITEGEIAGAIGQVRGVLGVKSLLMTAESARAGRTPAGDIVLPPHALPELGALEVYR